MTSKPNASQAIESLFEEIRRFPPTPEFAEQANAQSHIYAEAERDYLAFWESWARKLEWMKPFASVLEWNEPFARWFGDGELNVSVNCLDRHVDAGMGEQRRLLLRGRARRSPRDHLSRAARRRVPLCQRPARARHKERRSRRDLHADDSGTAVALLGLRAHRRGALGDLRRLLARFDRRPRERCGVRRDYHRRLRLAPRQATAVQARRRRGARPYASIRHCVVFKRIGDEVDMQRRARRLVERAIEGSPPPANPSA